MTEQNKMIDFDDPKTQEIMQQLNAYYKSIENNRAPGDIDQLFEFFRLLDLYSKAITEKDLAEIRKKAEQLTKLWTSNPKALTMATDKLTNNLFGGMNGVKHGFDMREGAQVELLKTGKEKKPIYVGLQMTPAPLGEEHGIKLSKSLNSFQRLIFSGLFSIIDHDKIKGVPDNQIIFSEKRIFQALTGKECKSKKDIGILKNIEETINYFRMIDITMDYEEFKKIKKIENNITAKFYKTSFLSVEIINGAKFQNGEEIETCYKLLQIPPYYEYLKTVGQLITIPNNLLKLEGMRAVQGNLTMQAYLIMRIEQARNSHNHMNNIILFDTIFKENQIDVSNSQKANRERKKIFNILDRLSQAPASMSTKSKVFKNYIKDYKIIGKNGEFKEGCNDIYKGIEIIF